MFLSFSIKHQDGERLSFKLWICFQLFVLRAWIVSQQPKLTTKRESAKFNWNLIACLSSAVFCATCRDFSMAWFLSSDHFSNFDFFSARLFDFWCSTLWSACRTFCRTSSWRSRRPRNSEAARSFLWLKIDRALSSAASIDLFYIESIFKETLFNTK